MERYLPPRETWEATRVRANEPVTWQRWKFGHQNPLNFEVAMPKEDSAWFLLLLIIYLLLTRTVVFLPFLPVVVLCHWSVCVILRLLLLLLMLLFWMVEFGVMIVLVVAVGLLCVFFFFRMFFAINVIFCPWFCGWFWWFHVGIYAFFLKLTPRLWAEWNWELCGRMDAAKICLLQWTQLCKR